MKKKTKVISIICCLYTLALVISLFANVFYLHRKVDMQETKIQEQESLINEQKEKIKDMTEIINEDEKDIYSRIDSLKHRVEKIEKDLY